MPGKNKRGGRGYTKKPRDRKKERFEKKYGMSMTAWAKFKKENPKVAHEKRTSK